MTTHYSPGCKNEQAHVCDTCKEDDGRPTLYWKDCNFDLCYECLETLYIRHIPQPKEAILVVTRKPVSEELRNRIYERDDHKCKVCGSSEDLCLDHIKPFSKGGKTEEENLQTLCRSCNVKKRAK